MKKIKTIDAIGMTLCHDITAMYDGFKGAAFKRGHIITEEDVPKLLDYGKQNVYVWEENKNELHEEDCAIRMSKATICENSHINGPSEGKVQLISDIDGFFKVNKELLDNLNRIEDITVCTIHDNYPVKKGMILGSMRIVPLVTNENNIIQFENYCKNNWLFKIVPYQYKKVGIIITGSEIYHKRIKDKFESVARKKLEQYPCEILNVDFCDDDCNQIIENAKNQIANGADLLLLSGGMSVDPDDVTPTAVKQLNAEIVTYGVPSQPGNMSLVAYLNNITLLGVPGAAVSLPVTVFDALLPQVFADIRFTKKQLLNLAEGGLCLKCTPCHFPNCTFAKY